MTVQARTPHRRGPGRPRRAPGPAGLDPREDILRHASVLFSANGVGATTVSDIARTVGLTPAAIYYHFAGLDDILAALVGYVIEETDAFSATADESASPSERLHHLIGRHVERLTSGPYDLWFVIGMPENEASRHRGLLRHVRAWRGALASILADGQRSGTFIAVDPRVAVATLSGLIYSALQLHHEQGSVDHEIIAGLAVRTMSLEPAPWPDEAKPEPSRLTKDPR